MEAFQEALAAPGQTHTPGETSGGTDFRVKLMEPLNRDQVDRAPPRQALVILVYDAEREVPIQDATVELESWMVEHDHGTTGERNPRHDRGGVYRGETNLNMDGKWELRLEGSRPNGDSFYLAVELQVG